MRGIKVLILAAVTAMVVAGCGKRQQIPRNGYNRFKVVERYKDGSEIVDKDTGYGYFIFYDGQGIVPLFDEYGHPYQENGWRDRGT